MDYGLMFPREWWKAPLDVLIELSLFLHLKERLHG